MTIYSIYSMYMAIIDWMHGQMVFHLVIYFLAAWSEIVSSSVYIELEGKEHLIQAYRDSRKSR